MQRRYMIGTLQLKGWRVWGRPPALSQERSKGMIIVPGTQIHLPALQLAKQPTHAPNAWRHGQYITVRLYREVLAIRGHVNAGIAASIHQHLATGAGAFGRWFAIGDFVQTYAAYKDTRALPAHFTHISVCTLLPGSVVNVGTCSALFGHTGGGEQAELLGGPIPTIRTLDAIWSNTSGHA
jgi:hypothetical protein